MKKIIQIKPDEVFEYLNINKHVYAISNEYAQFTNLYFTPVAEIHTYYMADDNFDLLYLKSWIN